MTKQFHDNALSGETLDQLFNEARSYNGWLDKDVSDDRIRAIYDLLKMAPTSANMQPARIVWVKSPEAKAKLAKKEKLRVLELRNLAHWRAPRRLRSVGPLLLVQDEDMDFAPTAEWEHGAGPAPDAATLAELERAWRAVKHVKSNAIVVWKGDKLLGAGAGQTSRVDSCRIAVDKARELGHDPAGAVAASDAFFPFPDGLEILAAAGVRAVVEPGGSIRDEEVLARADALGVTVMLTGRRHFRH